MNSQGSFSSKCFRTVITNPSRGGAFFVSSQMGTDFSQGSINVFAAETFEDIFVFNFGLFDSAFSTLFSFEWTFHASLFTSDNYQIFRYIGQNSATAHTFFIMASSDNYQIFRYIGQNS